MSHANNSIMENKKRSFYQSASNFQLIGEENRFRDAIPELAVGLESPTRILNPKLGNQIKTKLWIKNMVSQCCVIVVKAILDTIGLNYTKVELGEVEIVGDISSENLKRLKSYLLKYNLELIENKKDILVEKLCNVIIDMIKDPEEVFNLKSSYFLSKKFNYSYTYLSSIFSSVKGSTIQHFILIQKIERVKQLLLFDQQTLSEIAWQLNYSSVAHLSNQFKKITGLTPSEFKKLETERIQYS